MMIHQTIPWRALALTLSWFGSTRQAFHRSNTNVVRKEFTTDASPV